jgi:hypothetical protein
MARLRSAPELLVTEPPCAPTPATARTPVPGLGTPRRPDTAMNRARHRRRRRPRARRVARRRAGLRPRWRNWRERRGRWCGREGCSGGRVWARRPGSSEAAPMAAVARHPAPALAGQSAPTTVRPRPTRSSPPASTHHNGTKPSNVCSGTRCGGERSAELTTGSHSSGPRRAAKALGMGGPAARPSALDGELPVLKRIDLLRPRLVRRVRPTRRLHGPGHRGRQGYSLPTARRKGLIDGRVAVCAYDFT